MPLPAWQAGRRNVLPAALNSCRTLRSQVPPTLKRASDEAAKRPWLGPAVTAFALAVVELFTHGPLALPDPLPAAFLLVALSAIVFSSFNGSLRTALLSVLLLTLYGPRFLAEPGALVDVTPAGLRRTGILATIALAIALPTVFLRRREERLHARLLAAEREKLKASEERNRALHEVNETLDAFSYVVSHDLKEPVRALNVYNQALQEDLDARLLDEARDLVRRNVETTERLGRLISGLLEFSRAARLETVDAEPASVGSILRAPECLARFEPVLHERGVQLETQEGPPFLAPVPAACQILGNLILNAIQHNDHPNPRILVTAREAAEDGRVEVTVEDNGPGFPQRLRNQYARGAVASPGTIRSGFGLLIASRAAARLGGELWVDQSPSLGGAAVHVLLPVARAATTPPARGANAPSLAGERDG